MPRLSSTRKELLTAMMKEAIYEAAVSVLAEHGAAGMTMDRVAAAAKLAKGSLYSYFDSKQDLLQFVHGKVIEPIRKSVEDMLHSDLPVLAKLEAILRAIFDHTAKHQELFSLLLNDEDAQFLLTPADRTNRQIAVGHFAEIFRQGIAAGLFRPSDPTLLAEMFFGALLGFWQPALAARRFQHPDQFIQPLVTVFLHGIAAPASKP